ncbi:hypothetical protein CRD60_02575 [Bifidobacterium aemilianum]|uniref:Uncharacterized protein n=1 Tax=Bifidobacterium aemilianum TaxID=2493120 RepID=A0A366K8M0_9BIFI|nr:hypothetical protein [Bifidobacterium aemilianum]RBP98075.1 hypothetical protein CRD60_02575 [Bifidobacterium aemilianum]
MALDGLILMVTGILVAASATLLVGVLTAVAFLPMSGSLRLAFPWQLFLTLGLPIVATGTLSTLFTARTTLRQPAISVIRKAVGE